MPISVFAMTTGRKVRLLNAPAAISSMLMIRKIRLKYVNTFSLMMSLVVFAVRSICTLTCPLAIRSRTCAELRPVTAKSSRAVSFSRASNTFLTSNSAVSLIVFGLIVITFLFTDSYGRRGNAKATC